MAAAARENPAPDQVLRIAGSRPVTLDPALVRDTGSSQYAVELFAGLVKLDSELKVVADLAAGWEVAGRRRRFQVWPAPVAEVRGRQGFASGRRADPRLLASSLAANRIPDGAHVFG